MIFDFYVVAINKASFTQTIAKRLEVRCERIARAAVEISDKWPRRLLRMRSDRPRGGNAARWSIACPDGYSATLAARGISALLHVGSKADITNLVLLNNLVGLRGEIGWNLDA